VENRRFYMLVAAIPFLAGGPLSAAQSQNSNAVNSPLVRANSRVVQIDVSVKDQDGHAVDGLTAADFHITDSGKPRPIRIYTTDRENFTSFAPQAQPAWPPGFFSNEGKARTLPGRAVVILIDGINSAFEDQSRTRQQALTMLRRLSSADPIAIYAMSPGLRILHDYSTDHGQLAESIRAFVPVPPRMPAGAAVSQVQFLMDNRVGDTLNMLRAVGEHMAMLPGRKAVVWITTGFPAPVLLDFRAKYEATIAALNEAKVAPYPVDARGLQTAFVNRQANNPKNLDIFAEGAVGSLGQLGWLNSTIDTMKQFADATGGEAFYDRNDIDKAMEEAIVDARANYTLGFYVPDEEADGRFHPLKVQVDRPDISLQYRQGYMAQREGSGNDVRKQGDLESALLSPLDETAVIIAAKVEVTGSGKDKNANIRIFREPRTVSLKNRGGHETGTIDELFIEADSQGKALGKIGDRLQFTVTAENRAAFSRTGPSYVKSIHIQDGATQIKLIVRDQATGHVGSLTILLSPAK